MKQKASHQFLEVQGQQVELIRKRIKNLNLSVRGHEGHVRLSVPMRTSEQEIRRFVASRLGWIRKHQARLAKLSPQPEYVYESGELHGFLGRNYILNVQSARSPKLRLNGDDVLHLYVPAQANALQRQQILENWYRQQLQGLIPPLIRKYEPRMAVTVAEWRIRKMKTRWGTCNIPKRRIWINLELAKLPPQCLEYIVVHEMAHLLERGHNARFYALMDTYMPNWREPQLLLRQHALT